MLGTVAVAVLLVLGTVALILSYGLFVIIMIGWSTARRGHYRRTWREWRGWRQERRQRRRAHKVLLREHGL